MSKEKGNSCKHQLLQEWSIVKEMRHNTNLAVIPAITEGEIW